MGFGAIIIYVAQRLHTDFLPDLAVHAVLLWKPGVHIVKEIILLSLQYSKLAAPALLGQAQTQGVISGITYGTCILCLRSSIRQQVLDCPRGYLHSTVCHLYKTLKQSRKPCFVIMIFHRIVERASEALKFSLAKLCFLSAISTSSPIAPHQNYRFTTRQLW